MIKTIPNAHVVVHWEGKTFAAVTAKDGFFRIECTPAKPLTAGLHQVKVSYMTTIQTRQRTVAEGVGWIMVPHEGQLAFISDIDDTFLVSHSANLRKRLYVLLTKNAHSRKPFEGVVRHYELLSKAHTEADGVNPFFYVSSSEWNLYDFIKEFCRKNNLPEGVYLLSQLKKLSEVWKTGGTKHATKFMRISRILESFPEHRFVLLGDDSQMDPVIYAGIVSHFPNRIVAVYLRHVYEKNLSNVKDCVEKINAYGVPVCHFQHSKEAIAHSFSIGLIK